MNFNETLIELVKCREELWNWKITGHKNTQMVTQLWEEIAHELQVNVKVCKTRWKSLRDRFNKEVKKKNSTGSGKRWPHMEVLEFLRPSLTHRPKLPNIRGPPQQSHTDSKDLDNPDDEIIDGDSVEFTFATEDKVAPSSPLPGLCQIRQDDTRTRSSSPSSSTSTSAQWSRRKRRRTSNRIDVSDLLEAAISKRQSAASTSQQFTANEHFFLAFARFADGLSPSAQLAFKEGVMNAYKAAVALDAS
ncbi:hypothetical protein GE061_009554 [Apolygus lucorum]|uniref:MADF domain-containing protein n=1 Tax=Apolygus lucorum TaxID=248454 RepID=A0A8S9Y2L4_APOLU|nr:hypothetical protein GE061_009554 [Apolygus lucorum]